MTDPQSKTNMMGKIYNADYPTAGIDTTVTFNHSKSKTVRTILEEIFDKAYKGVLDDSHLDQAISDISKIIDEAKPEYETQEGRKHRYFGNDHKNGFRLGARQYQSNLKEALL